MFANFLEIQIQNTRHHRIQFLLRFFLMDPQLGHLRLQPIQVHRQPPLFFQRGTISRKWAALLYNEKHDQDGLKNP
jgi:hypothetical protein